MDQRPQPAARHYAGLDVSLDSTAVRVVDDAGAVVWRGRRASEPKAIAATLAERAPALARAGLETGQLSNWLTPALRRLHAPVACPDARHAKAAPSVQVNKTDPNDAFGLAQAVRTGWLREVAVKGTGAQELRMLLVARAHPIGRRQAVANTVRGLLKAFGLTVVRGPKGPFEARVRELAEGNGAPLAIVEPLPAAWAALRELAGVFDARTAARAKADAVARRLMTIPGVGVVVALAHGAVIDDPGRFRRSSSVGAYLGLTPGRHRAARWTGRAASRSAATGSCAPTCSRRPTC